VYPNAPFAQLFGIDPERASVGSPLAEYIDKVHPEDQPRIAEQIQRSLETGAEFAEELRVIRPDGSEILLYARGSCHRDADGKPVRLPGVALDITARKHDEQALQTSNEELQRVNRELEEFAYVAGHDLQEPLRMVSIYSRLLLENSESEDRRRQYSEFVKEGVHRMQALIRDLLTYSQTVHEEGEPGSADLQESFQAAAVDLQSRIQESGAVLHIPKLPTVRGDTQQLTHVFQNLLSNAIKYRQANLPIVIHISAAREGANWIISVRDNGIGFEPEYQERIFGLFRRLHTHKYPGTGLGLAICKRIVERYGGRIWATGELGKGATFFFSLPAADD
jgi:PAS domain S-box-containing protein